eukprot:GGOE01036254.1.p1 GENE.GGOE01036254.1~~GGOE01036254.1.p1  ORF type:complete len:116 (-),score=46.78 GGOE01036254.1:202-522(-)
MAALPRLLAELHEVPFADIKPESNESLLDLLYAKTRDEDIKATVSKLDIDQLDLLMKFLYKALELGKNSGTLFRWHAAVEEAGGLGCIVRVLTDKKLTCQDDAGDT